MAFANRFNLRPDEHVVAVIRRSVIAHAASAGLAFLCVFLAFFLIVPLFARGRFGVAVFVLLIVLGILATFRAFWFWYGTAFIITGARIIDSDQRGVFHRRISEAPFERVEDITIEIRGVISTIFHLGTVRVQTASAQALLELRMVPRPELVHELLGRLQLEARGRAVHPTGTPTAVDLDIARQSSEALTRLRERIDVELERRRSGVARDRNT